MEFVKINIKGTIEAERCRDRRDDLGDQAIEIREAWSLDTNSVLADVIDSFIVNLSQWFNVIITRHPNGTRTINEQSVCSSVVWVVRTEL